MKKKSLLFFLIFLSAYVNAQGTAAAVNNRKNSLFIELGGNGVEFGNGLILANDGWTRPVNHFSINYDRIFYTGNKVSYSVRVGTNIPSSQNPHIIPLMINFIFGKKAFHLELSAGAAAVFYHLEYNSPTIAFCSFAGVRYQPKSSSFIGRVGITPSLGIHGNDIYSSPLIGLGLGYCF